MCTGSLQGGQAGGGAPLAFSEPDQKPAAVAAIDANMGAANPVASATSPYDAGIAQSEAETAALKAQLRARRLELPQTATKALQAGADPQRIDQQMRDAGLGQDLWVYTDGKPTRMTTLGLDEPAPQASAPKQDPAPQPEAQTSEPAPGVPTPKPRPEPPSAQAYTVRKGDTLSAIAKRFYGDDKPATVRRIQKANGIKNADRIAIGQTLTIDLPAKDPKPQPKPAPYQEDRRIADDLSNLRSQLQEHQLNVLTLTTKALANGVDPKIVEDQLRRAHIDPRLWPSLK